MTSLLQAVRSRVDARSVAASAEIFSMENVGLGKVMEGAWPDPSLSGPPRCLVQGQKTMRHKSRIAWRSGASASWLTWGEASFCLLYTSGVRHLRATIFTIQVADNRLQRFRVLSMRCVLAKRSVDKGKCHWMDPKPMWVPSTRQLEVGVRPTTGAVSYTHLDVYKRQHLVQV